MRLSAPLRVSLWLLAGATALVLGGRLAVTTYGDEPEVTGFSGGRGGCPLTANCVSSASDDPAVSVDPLFCAAPPGQAYQAVHDALTEVTTELQRTGDATWVAYSRVFRFPDDVVVRPSDTAGEYDVVSGSRLGSGDLDVNADRVAGVRAALGDDERCA